MIVFGVAIFVCGLYWALWDGARSYVDHLVISNDYYILISWGFRLAPAILMVVGILALILAGISDTRNVGVDEY